MDLKEAKVYTDGSHFIATPRNAYPHRGKKYRLSRQLFSVQKVDLPHSNSPPNEVNENLPPTTPKDKFESAYKESLSKLKRERKQHITDALEESFENKEELTAFVDKNLERVKTNYFKRRTRLYRKLYLQQWSYFITFTYSDELQTEEFFRKKLSNTLRHLVSRNGWKYIGVWERGKDTNRLHFHGIFYIPKDQMIGELVEVEDYDTRNHKIQKTLQNTHFLKQFGRNDFKEIVPQAVSEAASYITKYMEKSGERLVYGGKLPTYFKSDIMDEDCICSYGVDDRKFILADDFTCIDDGTIIGKVSPEVIDQMPKCN